MTREEIALAMATAVLSNESLTTGLALRNIPIATYAVGLADDLINVLRATSKVTEKVSEGGLS